MTRFREQQLVDSKPLYDGDVRRNLLIFFFSSRRRHTRFNVCSSDLTEDSFWVNLIGKGYPAPRHKFRWCTERLKIKPSNAFITRIATASGQAILVLGSRKAESSARSRNLTKHEKGRVRDRLSPNAGLANTLIYTPIESWTNDDVWLFLMQYENAWGYNNKDLLTMYQGASEDGECPLVVDTSTPRCGDSRFG